MIDESKFEKLEKEDLQAASGGSGFDDEWYANLTSGYAGCDWFPDPGNCPHCGYWNVGYVGSAGRGENLCKEWHCSGCGVWLKKYDYEQTGRPQCYARK